MPEWLYTNQNYIPQKDKDAFLDKSILSILRLLSKIRAQEGNGYKNCSLKTSTKLLSAFVLIALLTFSQSFYFVLSMNVFILIILTLLDGRSILNILKLSFIGSAFSFFILLPSFFVGNLYSSIMIPLKGFAAITAMGLISHTSKWSTITSGLKAFWLPDIFILVFDITIKYLFMLGEFALNILTSLKLRSVGKNQKKYTSISGIAGTLFIISREMAEETYKAMECRGFTGEYNLPSKGKLSKWDYLLLLLSILVIIAFFNI